MQALSLHDDEHKLSKEEHIAQQIERGVRHAAKFSQPCRTGRLDRSRTERSVEPGGERSISRLQGVVEGADDLHN